MMKMGGRTSAAWVKNPSGMAELGKESLSSRTAFATVPAYDFISDWGGGAEFYHSGLRAGSCGVRPGG